MGDPGSQGQSGVFVSVNRGKRGISLDLRQPEVVEIVRTLATKTDVRALEIVRCRPPSARCAQPSPESSQSARAWRSLDSRPSNRNELGLESSQKTLMISTRWR